MPKSPPIRDFRPFIVCDEETFPQCRSFYLDLGFEILWESPNVVEFATGYGAQRFLLTSHIGLDAARIGVFHFWVDDVDAWHEHVKKIDFSKYPKSSFAEPSVAEWGWRILYVWDPFGTLLHIAEPHSEENKKFFREAPWMERS
ncbi:MAG: hypothetical protein HKN21_10605 [Candidatus Eisenbacteria bacterium]|uniref:VOC domain-containing protein n=1 Tax=Eiseniibacteriota bacterium TaxID=2212470 RepID=A0A7Y2E8J8_UNCEI|nr:hypothetical protein [Candidatus Eisenbacteria bacterium]